MNVETTKRKRLWVIPFVGLVVMVTGASWFIHYEEEGGFTSRFGIVHQGNEALITAVGAFVSGLAVLIWWLVNEVKKKREGGREQL